MWRLPLPLFPLAFIAFFFVLSNLDWAWLWSTRGLDTLVCTAVYWFVRGAAAAWTERAPLLFFFF